MVERTSVTYWDIHAGDSLRITGNNGMDVTVALIHKSGRSAKVAVQAPRNVSVSRDKQDNEVRAKHGTVAHT
jgi:sRNA-binding carbon storage regulator CsrA